MKYLNIVITAVVILMGLIIFKMARLESAVISLRQNNENISETNLAVMHSNQQLENSINGLRKQIEALSEKIFKK